MTDDDINLALCIIFGTLLLLFSPFLAYHVHETWYVDPPVEPPTYDDLCRLVPACADDSSAPLSPNN